MGQTTCLVDIYQLNRTPVGREGTRYRELVSMTGAM